MAMSTTRRTRLQRLPFRPPPRQRRRRHSRRPHRGTRQSAPMGAAGDGRGLIAEAVSARLPKRQPLRMWRPHLPSSQPSHSQRRSCPSLRSDPRHLSLRRSPLQLRPQPTWRRHGLRVTSGRKSGQPWSQQDWSVRQNRNQPPNSRQRSRPLQPPRGPGGMAAGPPAHPPPRRLLPRPRRPRSLLRPPLHPQPRRHRSARVARLPLHKSPASRSLRHASPPPPGRPRRTAAPRPRPNQLRQRLLSEHSPGVRARPGRPPRTSKSH